MTTVKNISLETVMISVLAGTSMGISLFATGQTSRNPRTANDPTDGLIEESWIDPSFSWQLAGESGSKDQVLQIIYKDGRMYGMRTATITSYTYYPTAISQRLGNTHASLIIQVGAAAVRLDVTDAEAMSLVAEFSNAPLDSIPVKEKE